MPAISANMKRYDRGSIRFSPHSAYKLRIQAALPAHPCQPDYSRDMTSFSDIDKPAAAIMMAATALRPNT